MKRMHQQFVFLLAAGGLLPGSAVLAAEEESSQLESYSVGGRPATALEQEKVVIERPTFENSFKFEAPKPSLSGIQLAKPKLQVMPQPEPAAPAATDQAPAASTPVESRNDNAGASPAVNGGSAGGVTRPVQPLSMKPPDYPREALRNGEEGFVVVEFTINADGSTGDIVIVEAEPRRTFDREARRAVADWRFEPAMQDGRPVAQRIRHTVEFTLNQ